MTDFDAHIPFKADGTIVNRTAIARRWARVAELEEALRPFAAVAKEPRDGSPWTAILDWEDFLHAGKVLDHD